jgi:antitoxin component of RelBE/YafQ-DinJ toxin-antitoxin module
MEINNSKVPEFENEEQESEYWDKHSPLDMVTEHKLQKVRVGGLKDRPIAIRLDSQTRAKLNALAAEQGVGPSTLARIMIAQAIESQATLPKSLEIGSGLKALTSNLVHLRESGTGDENYQSGSKDEQKAPELVYYGTDNEWNRYSARLLEQLLSGLGLRLVRRDVPPK